MVLPVSGVAVDVAAVALSGDDLQAEGGPDGLGQREVAISTDLEVGVELILAQVVEAVRGMRLGVVTQHPLKER
jgi:hypothetical protein